jgi:hypothetical protein
MPQEPLRDFPEAPGHAQGHEQGHEQGQAGPGDYPRSGGPSRRPGPSRQVMRVAAVAVVALLGGTGVAYAAGGGGSTPQTTAAESSATSPANPPAVHRKCQHAKGICWTFRIPPFVKAGFPAGLGLPGGLVHGQVVMARQGGGYRTVDVQRGKVTAVNSTSITLKSSDGYTASYAIAVSTIVDAQRDGIGSVKVGNRVSIVATVSGSKATAVRIVDLSLLANGRRGFFWQPLAASPGGSSG